MDPATWANLAAGMEGDLVASGPTLMQRFWNMPGQTAASLRGQWLHSGDLGVVRADGCLQIAGRTQELYTSGGEVVMPKEIEDLLTCHDQISQAFAIGIIDDRWGEIGCAVVSLAPGAELSESDVMTICRQNLPTFEVPVRVSLGTPRMCRGPQPARLRGMNSPGC